MSTTLKTVLKWAGVMDARDGSLRDLTAPFFGGQGTLNVPSWSPDSRRVAFVVYDEG